MPDQFTTPKKEEESVKTKKPKSKRKKLFKFSSFLLIFGIILFLVFSSQVLVSEQSSTSWFSRLPIIKQIKQLAESADRKLKGEERDRVNILLLGMGGKNHDGGYLTDTLIIASIEPSTDKISMISIPRDLAVPIEGRGWRRINAVNAYAEAETPGSGGLAISQAISDLINIPIDYYLRVDFQGFINIVDELGGVEVEVKNTLDDYSYPVMGRENAEDWNSRFEHLHVDTGPQKMDGSLALKFARSRHGINGEGSDFARAKRQQLIIQSVKNKALSISNIFKPAMIAGIIDEFNEHVDTNLKIWEILKLKDIVSNVTKDNITTRVIDNAPNGLLTETRSEQGAYLLVPKSGDFSEVQYFVNNIFAEAPKELKAEVNKERATIEVRNGTWINGLASEVALDLEKYGFTVVRIGNNSKQNFQKSVIFDLTYGEKEKSLTILKNKTKANIFLGLPEWLLEELENEIEDELNPIQPDFLLVIGQDADVTASGVANPENNDAEDDDKEKENNNI